jgi:hypothetical protein
MFCEINQVEHAFIQALPFANKCKEIKTFHGW